jgi:DNA polymerase I
MEWNGILIDRHFLEGLSEEYLKHLDELSDSVFQITGEALNLNSPKQIGEVLFERLSLPTPKKTKTGNHSTNVEVLEKLAPQYPVVQKILEYREVQKLLSTYIDALPNQILPVSGRVHSSFNQTITATGRLSSTNPNLQNIPIRTEAGRAIRNAFIANEGWVLISADYSQIELRILAHLSQDPLLIQAFAEDKDIHTQTASAIYGVFPQMVTDDMRRAAKTINFGLMYGMGPHNLSQQLGTSYRQAKEFITAYFRQFPTIKAYMEKTIEKVREFGYAETLLGRRRYLPEIGARNRIVRDAAERTAINTPVQGTAADIIKIAMIAINGKMITNNPNARLLLQVHDELVFEVPQEGAEKFAQWVVQMMANAFKLIVPIKVEVGFGKRWSDAH